MSIVFLIFFFEKRNDCLGRRSSWQSLVDSTRFLLGFYWVS